MVRGIVICMTAAILALGWLCHAEHEKACEWEAKCAAAQVRAVREGKAELRNHQRDGGEKEKAEGGIP